VYTYWHITPTRNVEKILREGLRPPKRSGLGLSSIGGELEDTTGKVYVTDHPIKARDIPSANFMGRWGGKEEDWTILELTTRERGKVDPDFGFIDYLYLTRPIPARQIEIWARYIREETFLVPEDEELVDRKLRDTPEW